MTISPLRISSTAWGIVGAIVCVGGFQVLKYGVGKWGGYVFAGIVVVAGIVMHFVYQRRLLQLRDDVGANDLRRKDDEKNDD